jgi:BirA family biotin operon repressor/biotin-[acetyl-CoA-carboxylase] ligase
MKALTSGVLRRLADGEFHSGEALARALGVSRASVWHAVRDLESAGLEVYKVHGRGYRLAQPIGLLDPAAVVCHLGAHAARFTIDIRDTVDSTNSALMALAATGAACGAVIAAEWQTRGRGRLGRHWRAGIGEALTYSLLWRFTRGAAGLSGLSLAIGIAIARALEGLGVPDVALKWPNDILWRGRKLGGVLTELAGDALGPTAAVIGVGINSRLSEGTRAAIGQAAADLAEASGDAPDRNRVLAAALLELHGVLATFEHDGFAPLRAEWQRRHAHQGARVTLTLPDGGTVSGHARGVAEDGALLLEAREGTRRFHSGEISLRPDKAAMG